MERARVSEELWRSVALMPQAYRYVTGMLALALAIAGGVGAAWALGWLAAVLIVGLVLMAFLAVVALIAVARLVPRINRLSEERDDGEGRRPRLEIVRAYVIPRGYLKTIRNVSTGEEREGAEAGTMLIVDVGNRPVRDSEGDEAQRVSGEISVLQPDGTVIVDGSRGHWVDAALGDFEKSIPAGASAAPMDVIAKLDDDIACSVFSERGFGEWHLHFDERSFMVDVVVKGHNTPRLQERLWVEHDGPGTPLRIVKRERI